MDVRIDHLRMRSGEVGELIPPRLRRRLVFRAKGLGAMMAKPRKRPDVVVRKGGDAFSVWRLGDEVVVLWESSDGLPLLFNFKGVDIKEVEEWIKNM
ncbi:MAG: hypothetical protein DRJ67_10370 [Thermoprotei archaeon]|nr:MAG: hypothetical protein DRJ67_10370 [Thermoprotei archaeon]